MKNFKVQEIVSRETYNIHGDSILQVFNVDLIEFLDNFHSFLSNHYEGKVSIVINDWSWGGRFSQRGLRDFSYYGSVYKFGQSRSQHKYGNAVDMDVYIDDVVRISPSELRKLVIDNRELWPRLSFIEDGVNWLHVDFRNTPFLTLWHVDTGATRIYR